MKNMNAPTIRNRWQQRALSLLVVGGVLLALYPLAQNLFTYWNQRTLQNEMARAQKIALQAHSPRTSSTRSVANRSDSNRSSKNSQKAALASRKWPLTRMTCAEIGLDAMVVSGQSEDDLKRGPGHDARTAFPGEAGNCVIAAHRNVYGSHFMRIDELLPGSIITLQTPDASYRYSVIQTFTVADTDTHIRQPPSDPKAPPMLTLFTCTLPRTATRVVVTAQLLTDDAS